MKPKKANKIPAAAAKPHDGATRPPEDALDQSAADSFREVEPEGFKDHVRSSIEAAVVDPDVQDSQGGE